MKEKKDRGWVFNQESVLQKTALMGVLILDECLIDDRCLMEEIR